jgi:hypothetical protein
MHHRQYPLDVLGYGKFDRLIFKANCDLNETSGLASPELDSREPTCIV